jgi:predicted ribosomally synthesized peptide with SipW-like signal peptide
VKRSILLSLLVIGAAAALLGAGSLALFNDSETSKDNTAQAGTLDLEVQSENPLVSALVGGDNLKPSDTGEVTIELHNVGSMDGQAKIHVANLADDDNGCNEPELEAEEAAYGVGKATCGADPDGELSLHLGVVVWRDLDCNNVLDAGEDVYFDGKLHLLESNWYDVGTLKPSVPKCVGFKWHVQDPEPDANIIQSDSSTFDIEFTLTQ